MMNYSTHFKVYKFVASLPLLFASTVYAAPLANGPLFLGGNISPNVMFTLDDSGSMQFEIMPGELIVSKVRYMFPRTSGIYGGSDYSNYVVGFNGADFDSDNGYTASLRSSHVNKIYYNPEVTYVPWSNSDGSLMSNASSTCAPHNPKNTAKGCRNLTVNNTQTARWLKKDGDRSSSESRTFYPAVYFQYNSGDVDSASSYTEIEIKSSTSTYVGGVNRTDCAAAPSCTYDEEIQNFANWYTYYRSRILLARAGIGKAFAEQGNTMRVGFAAINKGNSTMDNVSTGAVVRGVRQFTGTDRDDFFDHLYEHTVPAAGTPLRLATDRVGRYYKRTDDQGPWSDTPGASGGTQLECRQNYNILMTDGYWGGSAPSGIGNSDNSPGLSITNDASSETPKPTYTYTPELPFSDDHSSTLADVAMHYWKTDLRTDMLNKVPTNGIDPAFWQHMVSITVGLGVNGTLSAVPAGTDTWPAPTSNATKIDDLWHAAVNSRGEFFSASEPGAFAGALANSLSAIIERIGAGSAVATSSSELRANSRIYVATFNSGDWSGQLLSMPIDTNGDVGAPEWDGGAVSLASDVVSPNDRIILTKGDSDGVVFEYANLSTAQKAFLDKDVAGTSDNCGPERVAYLRGESTKEGAGGTFSCASSTVISSLRNRPTSKMGDIVRSNPIFVSAPNAGYSDVDHTGYAAFHSSYKNRVPMIYVGANDGTLHGFNACVAGVTPGCSAADPGKELIAYVPNMIYGNLNRLADKEYNTNHRFFVDGSPMVADVYTGAWKSVLVGGLNGGGKGYYALDVTNPTDSTLTAPNFTEANAASLVLWEFSDLDDSDMGYSYNIPSINPFTGQALQIVKMENNKWAVVVGNGYNSSGGKAVLYVLFISGGEDGTWTIGTDYIKLTADSGVGNGLSTPIPFDSDGNGLADVIYAGDFKGNMWKFDVSDSSPANWQVGIGGLPLFVSGTNKPIISPPLITFHPDGGQLVIFGTGKYLEVGDTTSTNTQSTYGIWDDSATTTIVEADLVGQVVTIGALASTSTQNTVDYSDPTKKGWYFDFPISGERVTGVPSIENGMLTLTSAVPSSSPCDFGGKSFVYIVDYLMGGMLDYSVFDVNKDRIVASDDGLAVAMEIGFSVGGVTRIRGEDQDVLIYSKASAGAGSGTGGGGGGSGGGLTGGLDVAKGPFALRGRITWRELIHK